MKHRPSNAFEIAIVADGREVHPVRVVVFPFWVREATQVYMVNISAVFAHLPDLMVGLKYFVIETRERLVPPKVDVADDDPGAPSTVDEVDGHRELEVGDAEG